MRLSDRQTKIAKLVRQEFEKTERDETKSEKLKSIDDLFVKNRLIEVEGLQLEFKDVGGQQLLDIEDLSRIFIESGIDLEKMKSQDSLPRELIQLFELEEVKELVSSVIGACFPELKDRDLMNLKPVARLNLLIAIFTQL